jgi:hypothetical protein
VYHHQISRALAEARISVQGPQLLERHEALQVGLPREMDDRHATPADRSQQLVASDGARDLRHAG